MFHPLLYIILYCNPLTPVVSFPLLYLFLSLSSCIHSLLWRIIPPPLWVLFLFFFSLYFLHVEPCFPFYTFLLLWSLSLQRPFILSLSLYPSPFPRYFSEHFIHPPPLALLLHTYWLFRNIPDSLQLILHFFLSLSNHIITSSCIVEDLIWTRDCHIWRVSRRLFCLILCG